MEIGKQIRSRRLARRMTQVKLAELVGCNNRQVWRYEMNRSVPSVSVLMRIATALGCTLDALVADATE